MLIKKGNLTEYFMVLFGFLGTMPIVSFASYTAFTWGLVAFSGFTFMVSTKEKTITMRKGVGAYLGIFVLMCFSCAICLIRMDDIWKAGVLTSFMQEVMLLFIFCYYWSGRRSSLPKNYIKGVYYGAVANMIWGYLQLIAYNAGIDLNNLVFRDTLHMIEESATHLANNTIKISGFCWNAANLAPLVIIGYIFSRNLAVKMAFVVLGFISGSRTLIVGMIFCLALQAARSAFVMAEKNFKIKMGQNSFYMICGATIALVMIAVLFNKQVMAGVDRAAAIFTTLANIQYEASGATHLYYLTTIPDVLKRSDVLSSLFGYGPGCSGFVFAQFYGQYVGFKWVVECEYVNRLWSFGILGFIAYYYWFGRNMLESVKLDSRYAILFMTFLVQGLFYNIIWNWTGLFIMCIFILTQNNLLPDHFKNVKHNRLNKKVRLGDLGGPGSQV